VPLVQPVRHQAARSEPEQSEFPWHQDNGYVSVEPATNVTLWIALDDVDLENGCVWVMPKSHQLGLLDHSKQSEASWFLNVPVEGDGVPAILKAGEGVAFTGLTLHRSKLNKTDRVRRGFFLEYAQADAVMSYDKSSVLNSPTRGWCAEIWSYRFKLWTGGQNSVRRRYVCVRATVGKTNFQNDETASCKYLCSACIAIPVGRKAKSISTPSTRSTWRA
jgi:hypothetical protein